MENNKTLHVYHLLHLRKLRKLVTIVKIIPVEECTSHQRLLVCEKLVQISP